MPAGASYLNLRSLMLTIPHLSDPVGGVTWCREVNTYFVNVRFSLADSHPGLVLRLMCNPKLSWMEEQMPPRFVPPVKNQIRRALRKKLNEGTIADD
jgi:hypothetical protein